MIRALLILLTLLAFGSPALAQEDLPGEVKPRKPKTRTPAPRNPKVIIQKATNGVLCVLTDPATADVLVKSGSSIVKQGRSERGEYCVELKPGVYDVEVTAEKHLPLQPVKATVRQAKTESVRAELEPTTGAVHIALGSLEPDNNLSVFIDDKKANFKVNKVENQIELTQEVEAGTHTLRVTHPTILEVKRNIDVQGGVTNKYSPRFEQATATLIIKTEPAANIFIDNILLGRTAANGELRIPKRPGQYTIKAEKDKYRPVERTETVSAGEKVIELKLERTVSTDAFADSFIGGLGSWDAPRTWRAEPNKMIVRGSAPGAEVGLVKDKVYDNFTMDFDVNLTNGKGVAWVVRARDKKNYYLFQLGAKLGGAAAAPRYYFYSFICENGVLRPLRPPEPLPFDMSGPDTSIHIKIDAAGPTIQHSIEITKGEIAAGRQQFGSIENADTFSYGTIGFATKDGEEFTIFSVQVVPVK